MRRLSNFPRTPCEALSIIVGALITFAVALPAEAATPGRMMAVCRNHAHDVFKLRLPDIETKYEGRRKNGTHAVNGTAWRDGKTMTFQCSFDKRGRRITRFVVNSDTFDDAKVAGTNFNATGNVPCARARSQPMGTCKFGVERDGEGMGMLTIFWPDGGNRVILFEENRPVRYDQSEADGDARMIVDKDGDLYKISIGTERFEIPEVAIVGD
jgi:hypothetical protein